MAASPGRRAAKGLLCAVLGLAILALAVEILLQIASLGAFFLTGEEGRKAGGSAKRTVLCVGDSFTYGMGATSREKSFPGHLEQMLNNGSGAGTWNVVNEGYPGRNSEQVLALLPKLIDQYQPEIVAVLCGANDAWSGAEIGTIDENNAIATTPQFEWKYRTGRLLKIALRGQGAFERVGVQVEEKTPPQSIIHAPEDPSPQGQLLGTIRESFQALDDETALSTLTKLEEMARGSDPDQGVVIAYAEALHYAVISSAIKPPDALSRLESFLEKHGDSFEVRFHFGALCYHSKRVPLAREQLDRARELLGERPSPHHFAGWFWRMRAQSYSLTEGSSAQPDPRQAAESLVIGFSVEQKKAKTLSALQMASSVITHEQFLAAIETVDPDKMTRQSLAELEAKVYRGEEYRARMANVTTSNLTAMHEYCQSRGIQFATSTYPGQIEGTSPVAELSTTGIRVAASGARVGEELERGASRTDIFVADGHCTDLGYRYVAEEFLIVLDLGE